MPQKLDHDLLRSAEWVGLGSVGIVYTTVDFRWECKWVKIMKPV